MASVLKWKHCPLYECLAAPRWNPLNMINSNNNALFWVLAFKLNIWSEWRLPAPVGAL